ncbi:MAG: hypothetical protein CL610_15605 [Anaerolineaceae bacterium]|nr:hypothetical protein [Anaerolineaceae bacterium]
MSDLLELCGVVLVVLLASHIWFFHRIMNPLRRLCSQTSQITQGDFGALENSCGGIAEIDALRRSMAGMVRHVRRSQEHSFVYAEELANGQEAERARIARELHDQTIQSLVAIAWSMDMAQKWVKSDPERAITTLVEARKQSLDTIAELRDLIGDLRPPALNELGLVAALRLQADKHASFPVSIAVEGTERRLDETHELALFRSAQEALINACRHGHATRVDIKVVYEPNGTRLIVRDNGEGFVPPKHVGALAADGHYGLLGIHERAQYLDGTVSVRSQKDSGTTITISLPEDNRHQPPDSVRDPVCSAIIEPHQAYASAIYQNQTYYFCCPVCQGAFQSDPETYLQLEESAT